MVASIPRCPRHETVGFEVFGLEVGVPRVRDP